MKKIILTLVVLFTTLNYAQIDISPLSDVPERFKKKYFQEKREYNPLQVGNMWQYFIRDSNSPYYITTRIEKDSIINGIKYYKKISYENKDAIGTRDLISWERNDSLSGISFMLDFEDYNDNGDSLEELPLDSLELPIYSRYKSYKYSYDKPHNVYGFWPFEKTVMIKDTTWLKIENDTVLSRTVEIFELFWYEESADKFGIISISQESPTRFLTGAVIDGKTYGTIVSVDENKEVPRNFNLYQNYPNPFNPSTTIEYSIPYNTHVIIKVYDFLGRKVKTLVHEIKPPGHHRVVFNSNNISSGVYFYTINAGVTSITKSMIYLK